MTRADALTTLRARVSQGAARVRAAWLPTVEAALAAGLAWLIAHYGLGHAQPFFAPVAAWICLGFSQDRELRSVAEVALGVSLGVGLGDLLVHVIGSGVWQIMGVLVVAALAARFLDRARLMTIQAGVQAIVVVALPANTMNPLGRWTDALVGSVVALVAAAILPHDVRRWPRAAARELFAELAAVLHDLSAAVGKGDPTAAHAALVRARATGPLVDEWQSFQRSARQLTRVSLRARRHKPELARLARALKYGDRAVRNSRVVCRRAEGMLSVPGIIDVTPASLTVSIAALGDASRMLGSALAGGAPLEPSARAIGSVAARLTLPDRGPTEIAALVTLLRSFTIDLLQAAGMHYRDAVALLPPKDVPEPLG